MNIISAYICTAKSDEQRRKKVDLVADSVTSMKIRSYFTIILIFFIYIMFYKKDHDIVQLYFPSED